MSHILEREKADRASKAWRLGQLGWTNTAIGERLGVSEALVREDRKNSHLGKIANDLGPHWNEKGIAELANRLNLSPFHYTREVLLPKKWQICRNLGCTTRVRARCYICNLVTRCYQVLLHYARTREELPPMQTPHQANPAGRNFRRATKNG